ncbi:MAG: CDP-glycerol glycerophosphotransferase family protein, partial [Propionibacteriales bacterium]|nr:CDP-glycerol glycerophosphotransferase family protein [Propionibacteriales bacterium]
YWTVKDHSVVVPEGGIPVVRNSPEWFARLRTAKYMIVNMYQPLFHPDIDGQVIIETFHGYPFKQMGRPHWVNMQFSQARVESYVRRAKEWDYLVSPARYATPFLTRDFVYDGAVLEIGYPRNDVLQSDQAAEIRAATRASLGVSDSQTAILYAPTFRDYLSEDDHRASMGDFFDAATLSQTLGPDYVVLIRGHAFHARTSERPETADHIVDVTDYPDPADLYLAADTAVLDYSSLRFDFAVTGKPMIFLVPDLELYQDTRGWLLDYPPTAPGPLLRTTAEVASAISRLDEVVEEYAVAYDTFRKEFIDLEDGKASQRLVDAVFVPRGDAPALPG